MGKVHRHCPWRAQEGIIRQLHFVPKAVGSHRAGLSRDGTAFEFQFPSIHHSWWWGWVGVVRVCLFLLFFFFTDLFFRPSIFYPWKGHLLGSFETKVLPLKTKTFTKPVLRTVFCRLDHRRLCGRSKGVCTIK